MPSSESAEKALSLINQDKSKILGMIIGKHNVKPGQYVPKADAQFPPELSFDTNTGTYLAICLDLDPPFASFAVLGPALHWIQPGFKPQAGTAKLSSDIPFIANFAGPGPPPGASPHRYVFLLYKQPEGFDVSKYAPAGSKPMGIRGRIRYDLTAFEKEAKLGPVVAANYFRSN